MGYLKGRMEQEQEQGWSFRDGEHVCFRCVIDPYLRDYVKTSATGFECDFCARRSRKVPSTIPFNDLMGVIGTAIDEYFDQAVNCMGWDGQEGGYQGITYNPADLVRDGIPAPSENEELLGAIIESLDDGPWCDRNPYSLSDLQRFNSSWDEFCHTVKHRIRYFFECENANEDDSSETIPVGELLDDLTDIICQADLNQVLRVGMQFYRIRVHSIEETCSDWRSLGSPPPEVSVSNRMSAAGISVFYGALDLATAKAEAVATLGPGARQALTAAMWTNTRPLRVLDLSRLPEVPSFYAHSRYHRDHLLFLRQFVESITEPVQHDGREHTEYVPSQIITEYFRHRYKLPDKSRLDGIIYPSARRSHGRSIVVFASQEDLNPAPDTLTWRESAPLLSINDASVRRVYRTKGALIANGR